ncbi:MAG TPA: hypothetical protein VK864_13865 [Longimicrobiales bacterium]|nr:hypothetical protein [Longimicrobiales bacterium]
MSRTERVPVRLVFADRGNFHELTVELPAELLARHTRIIDALRDEIDISSSVYVDVRRLVAAHVIERE